MHRELQEELAMTADRLERIGGFLLTAGGADEFCDPYVGRVQAPVTAPDGIAWHAGEASEDEGIRVRVWLADRRDGLRQRGLAS